MFVQVKYFKWLLLYMLVLTGLLTVPFDFHISFFGAPVERLSQENGVQFLSMAGIKSPVPPTRLFNEIVSGDGFTLEIWAATDDVTQTGPARIVSYSSDKLFRNFTLGQYNKNMVMRLRTQQTDLNGRKPEIMVEDIFLPTKPQHIIVTYDYSKEKVFINGKKRLESSDLKGNFSNWDPSYSLVFGNEVTGNRPWLGKLFLVAMYNRALSEEEITRNYNAGRFFDSTSNEAGERVEDGLVVLYPFDEKSGDKILDRSGKGQPINLLRLTVPQVTGQSFFASPYNGFNFTFKQVVEVVGNVTIFIPLGYLLYATLSNLYGPSMKIAIVVCLLGTLFTLSIEMLQYFSPTRFSSMTDVINNMLGTVTGIMLNKRLCPVQGENRLGG